MFLFWIRNYLSFSRQLTWPFTILQNDNIMPGQPRDGSGQNPTQDLTQPEAILANPTRPEPFFYQREQPEEIFLLTRKYFFP